MIRQIVVDPRPRLERRAHHDRARLERRQRHAVAPQDRVADHRRYPRPRRHDADQVERIGGRDAHQLADGRRRAHRAQLVERLGQRELLADEAGHEAPAADLAAGLEPTQRHRQLAPRRQRGLAHQQIAEHHAVASQELARRGLGIHRVGAGLTEQRPATGGGRQRAHGLRRPRALFLAGATHRLAPRVGRLDGAAGRRVEPTAQRLAALALDQHPQRREAIGRRQPGRHQLPQRVLDRVGREADVGHQLGEEHRAAGAQPRRHRRGLGRQRRSFVVGRQWRPQPRRVGATEQRQRRRARRRDPRPVAIGLARRQPAPRDRAAEAQLIEPGRVVAVEPRGQDLALPRAGRGLEPRQLIEHARQAVGADHLGALGHPLPAQEEPHERAGVDRLDLAAQPHQREPMDARQDPAVAPLDPVQLVVGGGDRIRHGHRCRRASPGERAAQDVAVGLEAEQRLEHRAGPEPQLGRQRAGGARAAAVEVRGHDAAQRDVGLEHRGPARRRQRRRRVGVGHHAAHRAQPLGRHPPAARRARAVRRPGEQRRAPRGGQRVEPRRLGRQRPRARRRHQPQGLQRVVQLVRIPDDRRHLVLGGGDGLGRQGARRLRHLLRQAAAQVDRAGPALLERRVVEERVGVGVQELVAERRRLDHIARQHLDLAALDRRAQRGQPGAVERLGQAVADGVLHQRVIGDLAIADHGLEARLGLGEHHAQQIGRAHAHQVGRDLLAAHAPRHRQRARHVPPPPHLEHRLIEQRLDQHLLGDVRRHVAEHRRQREAVRLTQRDHDAIIGGGGLELEVEAAAEPLAQRQAPRAVEPTAQRRVDDELHAAALVEEPLGDQQILARQRAQRRASGRQVRDHLLGGAAAHRGLVHQPRRQRAPGLAVAEPTIELPSQLAHLVGQLPGPRRRLAEPERDRRWLAVGVLDEDPAVLDAVDLPRGVAEQEDVAGAGVDREVLVDVADPGPARVLDHRVVGVVGDRATRGDREEPRAAPGLQPTADAIAVQELTDPPPLRHPVTQHRHDLVELRPRELRVRRRRSDQLEQLVLAQLLRRASGDDLLAQDVDRRDAHGQLVEVAPPHAADQRRALDQLIAGHREQPALGHGAHRVTGSTDPLQERRERARRADLHHEIDRADVDAELERRGRHRALHRARLEPLLGGEPALARHRAVVRHHLALAEALLERVADPLDQPARVDEHQRRVVLPDQLGDAVVDPAHLLERRHRGQLVVGDLDREVDVAAVTAVDDRRRRPAPAEQRGHPLDRLLGRRQPDPHRRATGGLRHQAIESLERQRQVRAALVAGDGVDLVDDHRAHLAERGASARGGEQDVDRLRRGHEDVRRPLGHALALGRGRVAGADADLDPRQLDTLARRPRCDLGQRHAQVAVHVVGQRLQRRHVQDVHAIGQRRAQAVFHQLVEAGQERGERLTGAGGRGDQRVLPGGDRRPAAALRGGGLAEALAEPARHQRVEPAQRVRGLHGYTVSGAARTDKPDRSATGSRRRRWPRSRRRGHGGSTPARRPSGPGSRRRRRSRCGRAGCRRCRRRSGRSTD